jgi:hypothetical protein
VRYSLYLAAFVLGGLVALAVDPVEEWAIAFGTAALSPSATEPLRVSSHSGDGRLSQGERQ